jgi:hypothetical protein
MKTLPLLLVIITLAVPPAGSLAQEPVGAPPNPTSEKTQGKEARSRDSHRWLIGTSPKMCG